jgi:ubiquinone/menaquinone biosynthesis C-methylase UbiE
MTHESTVGTIEPMDDERPRDHHVCPWWVGYLIASPLRKLGENPESILAPLVEAGMTAVDVGSAMGFFSLPLARMVGPTGRVVCLDVQQRMLSSLERRARRKGLDSIIETRLCSQEDLALDDLQGEADLALAVHVVHETAYPRRFLDQIRDTLCPGGRLLLIEPNGHVSHEEFEATRRLCAEAGLTEIQLQRWRRSTGILLERPRGS